MLFDAGIYTNVVVPPAVPPNKSLLRTSYMATHTDAQLDFVLETFYQIGKELELFDVSVAETEPEMASIG
jgi:8-amino-7-oxononanoate synthase